MTIVCLNDNFKTRRSQGTCQGTIGSATKSDQGVQGACRTKSWQDLFEYHEPVMYKVTFLGHPAFSLNSGLHLLFKSIFHVPLESHLHPIPVPSFALGGPPPSPPHPTMWTRVRIVARLTCLASIAVCQDGRAGWALDWEAQEPVFGTGTSHTSEKVNNTCTVGHATRYDMARQRGAPIYFSTSPLDDFERPRIEPMNATAGEQWEFDGISADGKQAFVFGFYRDPKYDILGTGNLRMYAEFVSGNGSRYAVVDYAEESMIESCPGHGTRGTWRGKEFSYIFELSADFSWARISWENPEAKGTVVMASAAPPHYADNNIWPSDHASTLTVPHFYWTEPIPVAELALDMASTVR